MAQTKKSGTTKASGSAKKTRQSVAAAKQTEIKKQPKRREIGALICLFMAVFAVIGYFSGSAVFINFFRLFMTGLTGWGFYAVAPALIAASIILGFHKGRPVRFRVTCVLLVPLMLGALLHLFLCKLDYTWGFKMLGTMYTDGVALKCGGMFGGLLAKGFEDLFSTAGAVVVFICALAFILLGALNMTIVDAVKKLREHKKLEYEPEESIAEEPQRSRASADASFRKQSESVGHGEAARSPESRRRPGIEIDIPVDDPPKLKKKSGLFKSNGAMSPDQLYKKDIDLTKDVPQSVQSNIHTPAPAPMPVFDGGASQMSKPMPQGTREPVREQFTGIRPGGDTYIAGAGAQKKAEIPPSYTAQTEKTYTESAEAAWSAAKNESPFDLNGLDTPAAKGEQSPQPEVTSGTTGNKSTVSVKKIKAEDIAAEEEAIARSVDQKFAQTQSYSYPPTQLLHGVSAEGTMDRCEEMSMNAARLENTIRSFGVSATISNITRGPSVTRYEMELEQGVKLNKLTNLSDDIALSLGVSGVRIAPIPDRISMVGIEVPNKQVSIVYLREIIESENFKKSKSKVTFALGKDIGGNCICGNIEKLPHMLIAGTTGSGKSVCMNSLIISLLYKATPDEVRLIMIDPKMIELGVYNGIPHLLIPVVTDPKKAAGSLQWAVNEMMKRYRLFAELGARDIHSYNEMVKNDPERAKLPQVVIVIDELADLMLVAAKEVEESICRIAQMARAAGMHLVIATQRPSADVITGIMKANIPSRIAFAVASSLESRIILDNVGAEKLVGHGDMLYFPLGSGKPLRVQGTLIEGDEVEQVVSYIKQSSGDASYSDEIINEIEKNAAAGDKKGLGSSASSSSDDRAERDDGTDELFGSAVEVILESGQASVSMLQRRLKLGYSRAARLVDQMEERGIVGPFEGSKPRQLLITRDQWREMQFVNGTAPIDAPGQFSEGVPEEIPEQGDVG